MRRTGSFSVTKSHNENYNTGIYTISKDLKNSEKAYPIENIKEPVWKCRYIVTLVSFTTLLLLSIHRTIMSIAIVAMVNNTAVTHNFKEKSESCPDLISNYTEENDTLRNEKQEGVFIWSPEIQGYILGCQYIGHVVILIPASEMAQRFGSRPAVVGSLLTVSILTMLIPPFAWVSASAVIVLQILRGFAQGMMVPCVTILLTNWSPKKERAFLCGVAQTAHFLGPGLGFIFGGLVCESEGGWPYVFYSIGISGLVLALYILFFIAENPEEHSRISKAELQFILSQQERKLSRRRPKVPWRQLLTSVPVYALIISMFGRHWEFSQFWTVHSTFLATILHYPIGENGILSASPHFIAFLTSMCATWVSGYIEKKEVVSVDFLRKSLIYSSSILYSLCLFGMYMVGCNRDLSISFSILSMGAGAMSVPGQIPVVQDMSPTFSGTLHSLSSSIAVISTVILPLTVGYLTEEKQTIEQWNKIFFIGIGVVMVTKTIFIVYGSTKIQPWNFVEDEYENEEPQHEKEKKSEDTRF